MSQLKKFSKEKVLPGELPEWSDVVEWLRQLKPGRYRFIMAVGAAFGTRISESLSVDEQNFFGKESENFIDSKNDYIRKIKNAGLGAMFLQVDEAEKRKVKKELMRVLGEQDKSPKTGPYTACCTNVAMGKLILEMLKNGEHLEELSKNEIEKVISSLPVDDSKFKFHDYRSHDYRRLHITLSSLDLELDDKVEVCCSIHGQRSREIFFTYFQWGLMQRRNERQQSSVNIGLELFETKKG